jgi:hypothetical protein
MKWSAGDLMLKNIRKSGIAAQNVEFCAPSQVLNADKLERRSI